MYKSREGDGEGLGGSLRSPSQSSRPMEKKRAQADMKYLEQVLQMDLCGVVTSSAFVLDRK